MGKFSVTPIHKDSLISVLLGNTSLKQWAMLRSNVGVIKKMSENLDILSSSADKLSSSLAEIKFGEFDTLIDLLDKSVDDKSIFGSETSKNILTVSEKIKILYENTKEFNKQLTRIDVDTVNDLVQIVSQPLDKTSIFSSLTSSIVTKFSNSMDKASVAVERLMKQFSGANVKDFKQFIDVLNSKMKKDSFFEFLGNYKTNLEFGNNLTSFVDSLRKLNEELKPLENLNLKDLSAFKDLIVITGKDFDKNALLSEKKSATVKDNLFLIAHGLYALNTELANLDIDKLKELSTNIDKLEMPSKKPTFKEKVSGFAHVAKETSMAVAYMGLALVAFGGALVVTSQLLQVNPLGVLGFVVLTSVAMAASMAILAGGSAGGDRLGRIFGKDIGIEESGKKSYTKEGIENAKDMRIALMYIAGGIMSFGIVLGLSAALFGVGGAILVPFAVSGIVLLMGLTIVGLAELTALGDKAGGKKGKSKDAIQNAKDMGIAFMFIAGGILSFAITIALVPKILGINKGPEEGDFGTRKGWVGATAGVASVFLVIGGIVGVFALLGAAAPLITTGTDTAATIAGVMGLMSLAVLAVAFSSKILLSLFSKGTDKRPDGTDRGVIGKALATMGNVVAGLGTFGLFVLSTVGLFWGLGLPVVSAPTLIGAVTLLGVSTALIMTAKSIKRVQEAMEGVEPSALKLNIANMVDAVLNGIIRGITGDPNATVQDNRLDLDRGDIVQFRRVKRVLKIFGNIAGSLSKFASGLRAFSKVGEIASLEYIEDAEGNLVPKIDDSKKIHVTHIAQSIADTFGLFLNSLINNTQNLTRTQARSLKILSRSLVGKKGLISGISEFAETIDTFSKFGAKGEIFVRNEETGQGVHVPITTIVTNITKAFTLFVQGLVGKETMFRREGELGRRMHTFKKTIMGKKGMLSGISDFSDTLRTFAELGATGKMTFIEYDAKGDPIIDPKELKNKPITITSIVKNIVSAFSKFATEMGNEAPNFNIGGSSRTQMDKLTKALMGEKKSRGREKSGLLAGILAFSETIQKFADYGEDGKIPRLDENGQIIPGSKPIEIDVVTKGIVTAISKFVSSLETQLKGVDLTGADRIDTKLKSFSKVIDTLDKMSKSSDGIDRISASIGSMAQNVQLLVESMGKLDVSKFESFSVAAATAAKSAPAPTSSGTRGGTITQSTADQTAQWNQMAETIGNKIAEKITAGFLNGEFNFTFYNSTGGKLEISNA
jgi:MFS family permease